MSSLSIYQEFLEGQLKPSSAKNYSKILVTLISKLNEGNISCLEGQTSKWFKLKEFEKVFGHLKKTTQRNYLSAVISFMKVRKEDKDKLFSEISEKVKTLHDDYENRIASKKLTKEEEEKWVSAETLADVFKNKILYSLGKYPLFVGTSKRPITRDQIDNDSYLRLRDFVIAAFYLYPFYNQDVDFGIMRNDLANIRLLNVGKKKKFNYDKTKNYFLPGQELIILNDYKTSRTGGEVRLIIPSFMSNLLSKWVKFLELDGDEYLFPGVSKHDITIILRRITKLLTGIPLGSQMLRKIYVTNKFGDISEQKEKIAKSMGHSVEMQDRAYTKHPFKND